MADPKDPDVKVVDRRWWARGETTAADDAGARKPTYIEELEQRLADTTTQLQQVLTEHRRAQQEFEEIRIRMRRDLARDVERGRRAVLADLLDVVDNLDRALASGRDSVSAGPSDDSGVANLARGVALVRDQFLAKLEQFGVTRLEALGQRFDAERHEAVSMAPTSDEAQDGIVVAVVREGYAAGDELLRPASVVVGTVTHA